MNKLTYKTFVFPQNPHTYSDSFRREPRYRSEGEDTVFAGVSPVKRQITGRGVFFGKDAYAQFLQLVKVFGDPAPGELVHPVWGSCYGYMTELELTQEPREDHVSYEFTFTGAMPDGAIPR